MNFNLHKLLVFSFALFLVTSCNTLDDKPSDSIEPSKAFRNIEDINMGLLGAYAALDYDLIYSSTIVSDEIRVPAENTLSNTSAYRWLYDSSSGSVTSPFYMFYQVIDRVNRVLQYIDAVEIEPSQQGLKKQYRGELLAIRAYAHFELLRGYASAYEPDAMGVPYMMESEIAYPSRDSFSTVIAAINQDLDEAKSLIPTSFNEVTRISKTAVSAIQARVALYAENWDEAITYSSQAIEQVPLASKDEFPLVWIDESNAGVIWKLARVTGDSRIGDVYFRQDGETALYVPSFKLIRAFDTINDIRFKSYIAYEPGRKESDQNNSAYLVKKYLGNDPSDPGLTDIKLFRSAEMYLIRAEAYAETENLTKAVQDLNAVRRARIQNYQVISFADKAALISAIYKERFKEFAFEGQRFFDLKRRNLSVDRLPEDLISNVEQASLPPDEAQYNFPIPANELAVNKNMEQNPNY